MRRPRLFALLLPIVGFSLLGLPSVSAGPWTNGIENVNVVCRDGWLHVNVTFTHRGRAELRVMDYATATATTGIDSDHLWFSGSGRDTFRGVVVGGTNRYLEAHLLKRDARTRSLYDVAPIWGRAGPYTC